jgi:signal transduction histidine kinase
VRADRSGLLQIFLNLAQNSLRALDGVPSANLAVTAYQLGESVVIRFADNGPGVAAPDALFQPFRTGASSAGLGLYVSRALIRTYGGELHYVRRGSESRFVIELPAFEFVEAAHV